MTLLECALDAARRGIRVFPLLPRSKEPNGRLAPHGAKDATTDEATIRQWWCKSPKGNIGALPGVLVDCDHGFESLEQALSWAMLVGIPETLAVRTGRRPEYGVQFHLKGKTENGTYQLNGVSGEVRSNNEYGLWAGSVHPESGEMYQLVRDLPIGEWSEGSRIAEAKDKIRKKLKQNPNKLSPSEKICNPFRHQWLMSQCGRLRHTGLDGEDLFKALRALCDRWCENPSDKSDDELRNMCGYADAKGDGGAPKAENLVNEKPFKIENKIGDMDDVIKSSEKALHSIDLKYFVRNGELVHIAHGREVPKVKESSIKRDEKSTVLVPAHYETITRDLDRLVSYYVVKSTPVGVEIKPSRVPYWLPKQIHDRVSTEVRDVPFPSLAMITGAPTLLPSGAVTQEPFAEGVLYIPPHPDNYPKIADHPTKEEAIRAMAQFWDIYKGFPFAGPDESPEPQKTASYASALAISVTLAARPYLGQQTAVPLIGVHAPTPRTGKTRIAKAGVIAQLGHLPTLVSFADEIEFAKELLPLMRAGDQAIMIDNIETTLKGAKLNSLITEGRMRDRVLGHSEDLVLTNCALFLATGNNLVIGGDLATRAIRIDLDGKMEHPEARKFDFDPVARAAGLHRQLAAATVTALRSYILSGAPWNLSRAPWGGFEEWDRLVCGCLDWLGFGDPYQTRQAVLDADMTREANAEILQDWENAFGTQEVSLRSIANDLKNPVREALLNKGQWDGHFARWILRRLEGQVYGNLRLVRLSGRGRFKLQKLEPQRSLWEREKAS